MFPVTEAIGDDVHWCIAEWGSAASPGVSRLCILESVREGLGFRKVHRFHNSNAKSFRIRKGLH